MPTGTVKWFNSTKMYGFIEPDNGGSDVFIHISAVNKANLPTPNEGDRFEYELLTERGKQSAGNLKRAS